MTDRGGVDGRGTAPPNEMRDRRLAATGRAGDEVPERVWTNDDFTVANDLAADDVTSDDLVVGMPTRPVIGPAIRRNARWWCAAGLVGLVLGAAVFTKMPPPYKATTSVLLTQPAGAAAFDEMLTEVAVASSHTVAEAAMRQLGLPEDSKSIQHFLAGYTAVSLTDKVILFTVKAPSSSTAVSRAQALAAAFLTVWTGQLERQQNDTIAAINQQITQGKQQAFLLTQQIVALQQHPSAPGQQVKIDSLKGKRDQANSTVAQLELAIKNFGSTNLGSTTSVVKGSQVLDPATPLPRSHLKYPVLYVGGGLAGGLALGLGLVIVLALVSTRLRRRDDISRALGAPVRLSLGRVRVGNRGRAAAGRREIRQIVAHLRRLMPTRTSNVHALALVTVDEPDVAAVALVSLAQSYARDGKRVIVADLSPRATAGRLLGSTEPGVHDVSADGQQLVIAIPEPDDIAPVGPLRDPASGPDRAHRSNRSLDRTYASADVLLTLTVLDPALWADHLATWATDSVVILTAGESTGTKIHTIGQMIRLAGVSLVSAILLGADKNDVSLGATDMQGVGPSADLAPAPAPAPAQAQAPAAPVPSPAVAPGAHAAGRGGIASTTLRN